jgi:hypothetical protein
MDGLSLGTVSESKKMVVWLELLTTVRRTINEGNWYR